MEPPDRFMTILVGLGAGLMLGALIFYISGSINLVLAMVLMVVFSIIGGVVGFNFPRILRWVRSDIDTIDEEGFSVGVMSDRDIWGQEVSFYESMEKWPDQRSQMEESLNYWRITWDGLQKTLPQEYRADTKRFAIIIAFDVMVGLGFILLEWYFANRILNSSVGVFIAFGLIVLSSAAYQFGRWFSVMGAVVHVSPAGLNYSSGRENWQLSWREIAETWERNEKHSVNAITMRNVHEVRILTRNRNKFKMDRRLRDFPELANVIQTAVTFHLLPIAIRTLQSGGTIDFSRWTLSNRGIQREEKYTAWEDVKKIVIYQARIQIRSRGKRWFNFAEAKAWEIPNFPLFYTISQYYTDVAMPTRPTFVWEE